MRKESQFFTVFPSVVCKGKKSEITITATHEKFPFSDDTYKVRIVPKEKRDVPRNKALKILDNKFNECIVKAENNSISFSYFFESEQEYRLIVFDENGKRLYDFAIYALDEDLYDTIPYRGDLHMHTTCSDGIGTIAQTVSKSREKGLDFICITDHHKYYPSAQAVKMFKNVDTGLKIFCGEEVHNCDMGYVHIVNFGSDYSVNEIIEENYDKLCNEFKKEAMANTELEYEKAYDFAMRKWICEEIRRGGGKAIFPHPYWTICDEYYSEMDFAMYTLNSGIYDIYEVMGGCTVYENQIQAAMWHELRLNGNDMPIVASTDTHNPDIIGKYTTIVFAKSEEDMQDAIMNRRSVGVESIPGEHHRVVGNFRLMKYGIFLVNNFYPVYESYTKGLGELILNYEKDSSFADVISKVNSKAESFRNKFFGK